MDNIVSATGASQANQVQVQASMLAQKKSEQTQESTASQLLQSVQAPKYSNPPNLGQSLDVRA